MSDLLKAGATMLFEHCPECNAPLFKNKDEVWCPNCNKRVIIVKEGEETEVTSMLLLEEIEKTIMMKLQEISREIGKERASSKLLERGELLLKWLEILEKIRTLRKKSS
jgi:uncharacterized Zn finger protein (UPF0148 family)